MITGCCNYGTVPCEDNKPGILYNSMCLSYADEG